MCLLHVNADASISLSEDKVEVGSTFTATVSVKDAAGWNVHLTSSGPVEKCEIQEKQDISDNATNMSKDFTVNCKATEKGTIRLVLTGDTTNKDGEVKVLEGSASVSVVEQLEDSTVQKSSNAEIKSIMMDDYTLSKLNDAYVLVVPNFVEKGLFKIELEDSKASVTGLDIVNLKVGVNKFKVVVTAEDGTTKDYAIKVTRKEVEFTIKDIEDVLSRTESYPVILQDKDVLTEEDLDKIKSSGKKVEFIRYDDNTNIEMYRWIVEGNKLNKVFDFDTTVVITNYNKNEKIDVELQAEKGVPKGIQLSILVDENSKKIYNFELRTYINDPDKSRVVKSRIFSKNGRVSFSPTESKYLLNSIEPLIIWSEVITGAIVAIIMFVILLILSFVLKFIEKRRSLQ